jgi:hypothetical protein
MISSQALSPRTGKGSLQRDLLNDGVQLLPGHLGRAAGRACLRINLGPRNAATRMLADEAEAEATFRQLQLPISLSRSWS